MKFKWRELIKISFFYLVYILDINLLLNFNFQQYFFVSEMAERHKSKQVLKIARDLIHKLQTLIENK